MKCAENEEQPGFERRRAARIMRPVRWWFKTAVGAPRSILVEMRECLSDEIMALPVFDALRAKYPAAHIGVLTNYPALFFNHPFVDTVNRAPSVVDRHILLRGAPRTVPRIAYYARCARLPLPNTRPHLYYAGWSTPLLAELPAGEGPLIALAPGAAWPLERWPWKRWQALAEALTARGCRLVELGQTHEPLGVGASLVARTSVREAACVLHHADLVIAVNNGLMHLALAAGSAAVGLFGPAAPPILIQQEPNFYPVQTPYRCAGYWNRPGPQPSRARCPEGHAACLEGIRVDDVLDAVGRRLILPGR
ncbi:MAG: glycosyltransferase family 9 protein [Candidatus Hydrogenedentota bacterium]